MPTRFCQGAPKGPADLTSTGDGRQQGNGHSTGGHHLLCSYRSCRGWWPCRFSGVPSQASDFAFLPRPSWGEPAELGFAAHTYKRRVCTLGAPGAPSPSPTPLPPFVLLPPIQAAPRISQPPEPGGAHPNSVPAAQQREQLLPKGENQGRRMGRGCAVPCSPLPCMDSGGLQSQARERPEARYPDVLGKAQRGQQEGGGEARRCNEMEWVVASGKQNEGGG